MPTYKEMYLFMVRQTNSALRLLREAKIDKIYQAIDLLENAHQDAEYMYGEIDNRKPFVRSNNQAEDKSGKNKTET